MFLKGILSGLRISRIAYLGLITGICALNSSICRAQSELFISEYLETTNNKCVEIFNPSNQAITLDGIYRLRIGYNGNPPTTLRNMVGVIQPKSTFVLCSASSTFSANDNWGAGGHNGNDALILEKNNAPIDIIGNIGCDPGAGWSTGSHSTDNRSLIRKGCITQGVSANPGGNCPFPTLVPEWESLAPTTSHLGKHSHLISLDDIQTTAPSDCSSEDGSIRVLATGAGIVYSIDDGASFQMNEVFTDLEPGAYDVLVRTDLGTSCQLSGMVEIAGLMAPTINDVVPVDPSDCREGDGSITIDAAGTNMEYSIDDGQSFSSNAVFNGLMAGNYNVVVRQSGTNDCLDEQPNITLSDPELPSLSLDQKTDVSCKGWADGLIAVKASGGSGVYNYIWEGPVPVGNVNEQGNLPGGNYQVVVADGNHYSCRDTLVDIEITEPSDDPPPVTLDDLPDLCNLDNPIPLADNQGSFHGTWSGLGVSGQQFDPTNLDGPIELTFTPDMDQCARISNTQVTVREPQPVSLDIIEEICLLSSPVLLGSVHAGIKGTWSGPGVTHPFFSPDGLSGSQQLLFEPDQGQCALISQTDIVILNPHRPNLMVDNMICRVSDPITLAPEQDGIIGKWNGPGVDASNTFDPTNLLGRQDLTFVPEVNQCGLISNTTIEVVAESKVSFDLPPQICASNSIALPENQDGILGTWSGPGVQGGRFDPNGIPGQSSLTFYPDDDQCAAIHMTSIEVLMPSAPTLDIESFICAEAAPIELNRVQSQIRGHWSGTGVIDNQFDPKGLEGSQTLTFLPDDAQCALAAIADLVVVPTPQLDLQIDHPYCHGDSSGNIRLEPSGSGPFTFDWNIDGLGDFDDVKNLLSIKAGSYSVSVKDSKGCRVDTTTILTSADPLMGTIITETDGAFSVLISGGTAPYQYLWSTGDTTVASSAAGTDTLRLTVSDAYGCNTSTFFVQGDSACALDLTIESESVSCHGHHDGVAMAIPIGGQAPYTYNWSHDSLLQNGEAVDLPAGMHTLVIVDALRCYGMDSFIIAEPMKLALDAKVKDSSGENGAIEVSASGGQMPYDYTWDHGVRDSMLDHLTAGIYSLTVTDANGCEIDSAWAIQAIDCDFGAVVDYRASCRGQNNGTAKVTVSNGKVPISYQWSHNPLLDQDSVGGLPLGLYQVEVSDDVGCSEIIDFEITTEDELTIDFKTKDVIAVIGSDGWIQADVSGGQEPYIYLWSNGEATDSIANLHAGAYGLTVTDRAGCMDSLVTNINIRGCDLFSALTINHPHCRGDTNGEVILTAASSEQPIRTIWEHDSTLESNLAHGLAAGQYLLTIIDAADCQHQLPYELIDPLELQISIDVQDEKSPGAKDGEALVSAEGGTPTYSYSWSNGSSENYTSNLAPGIYAVTVTDSKGCSKIDSFEILPANACMLSFDKQVQNASCARDDGSIQLILSNIQGSARIQWVNTGEVDVSTSTNLAPGQYVTSISDDFCSLLDTTIIGRDSIRGIGYTLQQSLCAQPVGAKLALGSVLGGKVPYVITLNDQVIAPGVVEVALEPGRYLLEVKDQGNCTYAEEINVEALELFTVSPGRTVKRGEEVDISADFDGPTTGLAFSWSSSKGVICEQCLDFTIDPEESETYTFNVQDSQGCSQSAEVRILVDERDLFYVPNAITPNHDGLNDELVIYDGKNLIEIIESFELYNKAGLLVARQEDFPPNFPIPNLRQQIEKSVTPEVFMYLLSVRFRQGYRRSYRGSLHIIR